MPTVIGSVSKHDVNGEWHKITIADLELSTKQAKTYDGLKVGMHVTAEYTEKVNGQYTNRFLSKWQLTDSPAAPATQDKDGHVAIPDMDAKDRRITALSAYSTAAKMMTALAGTKPEAVSTDNLHRLAHAIYKRVQLAGQDKPWGAEE